MPYQNIQANLTDPDQTLILQKADEILALLPFVVNLTKQEKIKGRRMGRKTEKFFIDILKTITSNPVYKPNYVDGNDFGQDLGLYIQLLQLEAKFKGISEMLADTRTALSQEIMKPSLAVYNNVQSAAQANVPGADAVLNDLKPYFKVIKKKAV